MNSMNLFEKKTRGEMEVFEVLEVFRSLPQTWHQHHLLLSMMHLDNSYR